MRIRITALTVAIFALLCWRSNVIAAPPADQAAPATTTYKLLAWSELGMHCIDGKDYSVFAVLPPYNIVHAQLIQMGNPPHQITSGVKITYEATADPTGSLNTISSTKTNFWSWVNQLFLASPPPDVGLTGNPTQSRTPRPLAYDSANGYWTADGIPTMPYDDSGNRNAYSMSRIVARDPQGNVLATAKIVLSVSDELTCNKCHASNSDVYAKPDSGWENNPDPAKDTKLNILKKHDDRVNITQYLSQLQQMGYVYQSSLYQTATSGTPVLCAVCHSSNALGTSGLDGIRPMTSAMHTLHGPQINLDDGMTLDQETLPQKSCYLCHPGVQTHCQRGAMHRITCQSCHGNLSQVGDPGRRGWLDVPACQMCHTNHKRYTTTFDSPGHWRVSTDPRFATNPDRPLPGTDLYRYSAGHGQLYCSGCHGSPHAELPSLQRNDNIYSGNFQGHGGPIAECNACHTAMSTTPNNGPHGLHTVGQSWVNSHGDYVNHSGASGCSYCHGPSYHGGFLSKTSMARSFTTDDGGHKTYSRGDKVGCYDCHNGPHGG